VLNSFDALELFGVIAALFVQHLDEQARRIVDVRGHL
jgi:hypothetical protein